MKTEQAVTPLRKHSLLFCVSSTFDVARADEEGVGLGGY